jgi:hypothetical protein
MQVKLACPMVVSSKYDDRGNAVSSTWYNSDGSIYLKDSTKYDDKNNRIEFNSHYLDGGLNSKTSTKYDYDEKNNWIKCIVFSNDNTPLYILEREIEYY